MPDVATLASSCPDSRAPHPTHMGTFEKDRDLTEAPTDALTVDASTFRVKAKGFAMARSLPEPSPEVALAVVGPDLVKDGYVSVDAARPDAPAGTGALRVEKRPGAKLLHGSQVVVRIPEEAAPSSSERPPTSSTSSTRTWTASDKPPSSRSTPAAVT